jgi:hypothetical protein
MSPSDVHHLLNEDWSTLFFIPISALCILLYRYSSSDIIYPYVSTPSLDKSRDRPHILAPLPVSIVLLNDGTLDVAYSY